MSLSGVVATPLSELEAMLAQIPTATTTRTTINSNANQTGEQKPMKSDIPYIRQRVNQQTPAISLRFNPIDGENEIRLPTQSDSTSTSTTAAASTSTSTAANSFTSSVFARICSVCHRQVSKYTCPRCQLSSCSLTCYQSHSSSCTQQLVASTLQQEQSIDTALRLGIGRTRSVLPQQVQQTREKRIETAALLQRVTQFNSENDSTAANALSQQQLSSSTIEMNDQKEPDEEMDTDEETQSERMLAALELLNQMESESAGSISTTDFAKLESILSSSILKDFNRSLVDGRMSNWLPRWSPWWRPDVGLEIELASNTDKASGSSTTQHDWKQRELTPDDWSIPTVRIMMVEEEDSLPSTAPPVPTNLPTFSSLFSGTPSPSLPLQVIELLYTYAYTMLLHNGDETDILELVNTMCELSPIMRGQQFQSTPAAAPQSSSDATDHAPINIFGTNTHPLPSLPQSTIAPTLMTDLSLLLNHLIELSVRQPTLKTSCCWSIARLGDTAQLMREKQLILRSIHHIRTLVDRAHHHRKEAKTSTSASSTSSSAGATSFKLVSKKLTFLLAFIHDRWHEDEMKVWNRSLYQQWSQRWNEHMEMHDAKQEAENQAKQQKVTPTSTTTEPLTNTN